jgi:NAD(P)-dependent dehydrogenase (short-subunit alcohol dehydrogenase family)
MAEHKHGAARDDRPLAGRVALVTGGSRGIGRGIAVELLRAGASVVIGDLVDREMEEACRDLAAEGPIDWVKLDVADHDSRHAAVNTIRAKHGPIAILVNNAGIASAGFFDDEDPKRIGKELAVDLTGAICLTRMVLPHMVEVGWGRITNISSMMAFTGSPGFAIYSAAKAGLLSFSEAIDRELRYLKDLHVTAVLPPSVKTQAFEEAKRNEPGMMRWNLVPPVSVELVARRTVRGLIKGRRHVYCALQSYVVSLLHRFLPWVLDLVLMYMFVGRTPPRAPQPGARLPAASA